MIIMLCFGYIIGYVFMVTDLVHIEFAQAGVNDVLPEWQSYDDGVFYVKLQMFIGYAIMFMGVAQFVYTATRREQTQYIYGG